MYYDHLFLVSNHIMLIKVLSSFYTVISLTLIDINHIESKGNIFIRKYERRGLHFRKKSYMSGKLFNYYEILYLISTINT